MTPLAHSFQARLKVLTGYNLACITKMFMIKGKKFYDTDWSNFISIKGSIGTIIIKRVSWFKSSLLLRIKMVDITNINS